MSALFTPKLLTVEELERIPDPPGGRYELHHGEAVFVTYPTNNHKALQRRIRKLLEHLFENAGIVDTEYPYRPFPEHELWGADVAFLSEARYKAITGKWLVGSPELVVEVKSPSNTKKELEDKAMTALASGAEIFWLVNPENLTVTLYHKIRGMTIFALNDLIPLV